MASTNNNPASLLSMPRAEIDALSNLTPALRKSTLNLLRRYYANIYHPDRTGQENNLLNNVNMAIDSMISSFRKHYLEAQPGGGVLDGQMQRLREDNTYLRNQVVRERAEVQKLKDQIAFFHSQPRRTLANLDYKERWAESYRKNRQYFHEMRRKTAEWRSDYKEVRNGLTGVICDILKRTAPPEDNYAGSQFIIRDHMTRLQVEPNGQVTWRSRDLPVKERGRLLGFISTQKSISGRTYRIRGKSHLSDIGTLIHVLTIIGGRIRHEFIVKDSMVTFDGEQLTISGSIKRVQR